MSLIATVTGAASAQGVKAEQSTGKLELIITGVGGNTTFKAFVASLATLQMEVNKQTRNGSQTVLQRASVLDLFEAGTTNEGIIGGSVDGANKFTLASSIELTDHGSIQLADGEFFEINFFNFPAAAGAVYGIDVYAIDAEERTSIHNIYEKQYINAESPREISVGDAKTMLIPSGVLTKLEVVYYNGRRITYSEKELIAKMRDELADKVRSVVQTDTSTLINTVSQNLIFNCSKAVTVKVTTSVACNAILIKHANL